MRDPVARVESLLQRQPEVAAPPLTYTWAGDMKLEFDKDGRIVSRDFVQGLLSSATLAVVFGESGSGKTFFVLHIALHIALGKKVFGRRIEQGSVLYIAAEGAWGVTNRIMAFRKHYNVDGNIPLAVVPLMLDLRNPMADTERVIAAANAVNLAHPPLRLIVIDTMSRAMAGGNENSPEDMGAVIGNGLRIVAETGACVLFIHHAGKDASKGARGHSKLRCDSDIEIEIARQADSPVSSATSTKQKDGPSGDKFGFTLLPVDLGLNKWDEAVTSCIVQETDAPARGKRLPHSAQDAFDALTDLIARSGAAPVTWTDHILNGRMVVGEETWRQAWYDREITAGKDKGAMQASFRRAAKVLKAAGRIGVYRGQVWIV